MKPNTDVNWNMKPMIKICGINKLKRLLHFITAFVAIAFLSISDIAFGADSLAFQLQWEYSTNPVPALSVEYDKLNRPFFYVAVKDSGLMIFETSNPQQPNLIKTIPIADFDSLEAIDVFQQGDYLYLAVGNIFQSTSEAGIAIVDISDPPNAFVTDVWQTTDGIGNGAGIVVVEGNYAYLGGMGQGLIILDISDKINIQFVSQTIPDINFPTPNPSPELQGMINARGIAVRDSVVYLAYDYGGLRVINVADKSNPLETGRYINSAIQDTRLYYNSIALNEDLCYIGIDYCGFEIVDISDTSNISLVGWWHPWECNSFPDDWLNSDGHINQISYVEAIESVFLAAGDSELRVVDVSNPAQPQLISSFGMPNNNQGSWGVEVHQQQVYLTYVPAFFPFFSLWAGIKLLDWQIVPTGIEQSTSVSGLPQLPVLHQNYPNPFNPATTIRYDLREGSQVTIRIYNSIGEEVVTLVNEFQLAGSHSVIWDGRHQNGAIVGSGTYFYQLEIGGFQDVKKMIILK